MQHLVRSRPPTIQMGWDGMCIRGSFAISFSHSYHSFGRVGHSWFGEDVEILPVLRSDDGCVSKCKTSLIHHAKIHKECRYIPLRFKSIHVISIPTVFSFFNPVIVSVCSCLRCCFPTKKLVTNANAPTQVYKIHMLRILHANASLTAI